MPEIHFVSLWTVCVTWAMKSLIYPPLFIISLISFLISSGSASKFQSIEVKKFYQLYTTTENRYSRLIVPHFMSTGNQWDKLHPLFSSNNHKYIQRLSCKCNIAHTRLTANSLRLTEYFFIRFHVNVNQEFVSSAVERERRKIKIETVLIGTFYFGLWSK